MKASNDTKSVESLFVYTGQRLSLSQALYDCGRATFKQTHVMAISSTLLAASLNLSQALAHKNSEKWNWSYFQKDWLVNFTAGMCAHLVAEAAYSAFRLAGYDFGNFKSAFYVGQLEFFAPRYILSVVATTYLKTLSTRSLLGFTATVGVVSLLMPKDQTEKKEVSFKDKVAQFIALDKDFSERQQLTEMDDSALGEIQATLPDYKAEAYKIINLPQCTIEEIEYLMEEIKKTSEDFQTLFHADLKTVLGNYKTVVKPRQPTLQDQVILQCTRDFLRYIDSTTNTPLYKFPIASDAFQVAVKLVSGAKIYSDKSVRK